MRRSLLVCSSLLLFSPLLSRGQIPAEPTAVPRFYVGLAAYHSNFQNVWDWQPRYTSFPVPVQLTAGYQLRPRLALELGVAYRGNTRTVSYKDNYPNTGGPTSDYSQFSNTTTWRVANVSALARYTLTRQPEHRFRIDALAGFTLVHSRFYSLTPQSETIAGSFQTNSYTTRSWSNHLLLTAGGSLRYRLAPRFELNFDIATNRNLNHPYVYNGFTGSAALGVRYRFGQP